MLSVKQRFRGLLGVTVTVSSQTCQCDLGQLYHVYICKIASNNSPSHFKLFSILHRGNFYSNIGVCKKQNHVRPYATSDRNSCYNS